MRPRKPGQYRFNYVVHVLRQGDPIPPDVVCVAIYARGFKDHPGVIPGLHLLAPLPATASPKTHAHRAQVIAEWQITPERFWELNSLADLEHFRDENGIYHARYRGKYLLSNAEKARRLQWGGVNEYDEEPV